MGLRLINYYDNTLRVSGAAASVKSMMHNVNGIEVYQPEGMVSTDPQFLAFNALIPMPAQITTTPSKRRFALQAWGNKSGCWDVSMDSGIFISKQSSWVLYNFKTWDGPPQMFILQLSRKFEDLSFRLTYNHTRNYPKCTGIINYKGGTTIRAEVHTTIPGGSRQHSISTKFSEDGRHVNGLEYT